MSWLPRILRLTLRAGQKLRVNITPHHFYSDVPDLAELERETHWRRPYSTLDRVAGSSLDEQAERFNAIVASHASALNDFSLYHAAAASNEEAGGYGEIEALFLYCFIRERKPPKIVQIGCGVSTVVILRAIDDTTGYAPTITCVEPYPSAFLRRMHDERKITLVARKAQEVEEGLLTDVGEGGLLFVDSTHTIKVGSEVVRIITEILPRLPRGTHVHFHDISWPYDYGTGILEQAVFFWRESTLLYAYLLDNPKWRIDVSLSMLHHDRVGALKAKFSAYRPRPVRSGLMTGPGHFPSSTYLLSV